VVRVSKFFLQVVRFFDRFFRYIAYSLNCLFVTLLILRLFSQKIRQIVDRLTMKLQTSLKVLNLPAGDGI
jgi:hypothetical protein